MITATEARKMLTPNIYTEGCLKHIESAIKATAPHGRWCEVEISVKQDICNSVYDFIVEKLHEFGYNIIRIDAVINGQNKHIKFRISW